MPITYKDLEEGAFFISAAEEKPKLRKKISSSLTWAYRLTSRSDVGCELGLEPCIGEELHCEPDLPVIEVHV